MSRLWFIIFFATAQTLAAQTVDSGAFESFAEQFFDLAPTDDDEQWSDELIDELYELYCHPLNLNDLDEADLASLPFLTAVETADVADYVAAHRPVLSTGELMAIASLSYQHRRLLQMFTYAGPMPAERLTVNNLLQYARNDLCLRTDLPLYTRMGFANYPSSVLAASPNKVYRGSQPYLSARYAVESMHHAEAGFQLEKDAGERGVDYWAAYATLHDIGRLRTLAIGDYRVSYGLGLVVNTASGFGKTMMFNSLGRMDRGIRRHSSMQEDKYMSGVAADVELSSRWSVGAFVSRRRTDAILTSDHSGVSSMKTDGMHRTELEFSRRGNLTKTDVGGNVAWQGERLRLSLTAAHTRFSLPLKPSHDTPSSLYRLYNATGDRFTAFSLAYRYVGRRVTLTGETASAESGGVGTLAMLQCEASAHRLTLIGRYYSRDFVSINGQTFSSNSRPQNESGLYLGWQHNFGRQWSAEAYADVMYFPWKKYGVSRSSYGVEAMANVNWQPCNDHSISLRYRLKSSQHDWKWNGELMPELIVHSTNSLRLTHLWTPSANVRLKSSLHASLFHRPDQGFSKGWAASESAAWRCCTWLRAQLALTYFRTDDYSTRVYSYEPSLLFTYGMTTLNGHGMRGALLTSVSVTKGLDMIAKLSSTRFFDRQSISTGPAQIPQNHREDLQLQLHWQF